MSKIQEYGLACAEAVFAACRGDASAPGFPKRVDLAAIVAGVPLPEPEVAREPSGPGCSMPDREGWWLVHKVVGKLGRFYGPLALPTAPETGEEQS